MLKMCIFNSCMFISVEIMHTWVYVCLYGLKMREREERREGRIEKVFYII